MGMNWTIGGYQRKIIRGYVHDEKGRPVRGAVVILEQFYPKTDGSEFECKGTYLGYRVTNRYGYYGFSLCDSKSYYIVKVFNPMYH